MKTLTEPLSPHDHVLGDPLAPVNLVEYGDFECPFCGRARREVDEALRRVGADVCFAFRHFPIARLHPHALFAAQAAEAAGMQDRFWEMHATLFDHQDALEPGDLLAYARSIGLDIHRFAEELRSGVHLPRIEHDIETGIESGVNGTPAFFLNGRRHERGWDADTLTEALRAALGRKRSFLGRIAP